jgi:hypothetical protein
LSELRTETKAVDLSKRPFRERTKWEGSRVRVLTLDMKPIGTGVIEYVSIESLPADKREELRRWGNSVWTRVHMDDGTKLFAYDHYIQFIDEPSTTPFTTKKTETYEPPTPKLETKLTFDQLEAWRPKKVG